MKRPDSAWPRSRASRAVARSAARSTSAPARASSRSRLYAWADHQLAIVRADGGRGFRPASFDLVLANLMALLLVDRSVEIRSLVAPGGGLVLSGLLLGDVERVHEAFADLGTPERLHDGEWAALLYEGAP